MNDLDRYAVSLENMEVLRAQVEEQAREIERLEAEVEDVLVDWGQVRLELAALKAQPIGVVDSQRLLDWNRSQPEPRPIVVGREYQVAEACARLNSSPASAGKFTLGDRVRKTNGSQWHGTVVGTYSTALTPEGYAVESSTELGSVQIYPAAALEACE